MEKYNNLKSSITVSPKKIASFSEHQKVFYEGLGALHTLLFMIFKVPPISFGRMISTV